MEEGLGLLSVYSSVFYVLVIFLVARWQLMISQRKVKEQQNQIIKNSNLAVLGEVSSGIAHEINNPLQTLTFQLEILRRSLKNDPGPKVEDTMSNMHATLSRVAKMVTGLKNLTTKTGPDSPDLIDLGMLIEDVKNVRGPALRDNQISFDFSCPKGIQIKGIYSEVSLVLMNLMNNSIEAVEKADKRWIRINVTQANELVTISISDSGPRIPDMVASQMMRPFYTTKDPSKGAGIGLAIANSIVSKNGGTLYYDAVSPHTRFVIEYPL